MEMEFCGSVISSRAAVTQLYFRECQLVTAAAGKTVFHCIICSAYVSNVKVSNVGQILVKCWSLQQGKRCFIAYVSNVKVNPCTG